MPGHFVLPWGATAVGLIGLWMTFEGAVIHFAHAQAMRQLPRAACLAMQAAGIAATPGADRITRNLNDPFERARATLDAIFDGRATVGQDCDIGSLSATQRRQVSQAIPGVRSAVSEKLRFWSQEAEKANTELAKVTQQLEEAGRNSRRQGELQREADRIAQGCRECGQSREFQEGVETLRRGQEQLNNRVSELALEKRDKEAKAQQCERNKQQLDTLLREMAALTSALK